MWTYLLLAVSSKGCEMLLYYYTAFLNIAVHAPVVEGGS